MKVSLCSLVLLSLLIFSIKEHSAYPYSNLSQVQQYRSTSSFTMTFFDLFAFEKKITNFTTQNKTLTYDSFTEKFTSSTPASVSTSTSTPQSKSLAYDLFTYKLATPASRSIPQSEPLAYKYDLFTYKPTVPASKSTSQSKPYTYDPYIEKSTTRIKKITLIYNSIVGETTTSEPVFQTYRNRYNFRHRFRNSIITIVSPLIMTPSRQRSRGFTKAVKTANYSKFNKTIPEVQNYAYIRTAPNSTPMVHLNITIPRALLEGKFPRLASPYIIRITLPRKLAPKSNATLPNRGFLRIVGSPINMIQDGNLGLILGKIANQIGNAYNMSGKDIQKLGHMIVVGPGGQMINRKVTPPKKTTLLTSPMMMTARLRLRPNCTLPKITEQVIYFEDYIKYFELY